MDDSELETLADHRRASQTLLKALQLLGKDGVDQAVVKTALMRGHSQGEIAKALGMSKSDVNWLARHPYRPMEINAPEIARQFLRHVWGSETAARRAHARVEDYDLDRLGVRHPGYVNSRSRVLLPVGGQICEAVRRNPGISDGDLRREIVLRRDDGAALFDVDPDLFDVREEADADRVAIDGAGCWWPVKTLGQMRVGDEIPQWLGDFESRGRYEWVTINRVTEVGLFEPTVDLGFTTADGQPGELAGLMHHELYPVRQWQVL